MLHRMVWGFTAPKSLKFQQHVWLQSSVDFLTDDPFEALHPLLRSENCCFVAIAAIGSTCAPSTFVRASLGFTLCGIHLGRPPTASKDSLIIATSKAALSSLSKRALASITTKFLGPFGIYHKKASSWPSVLLYTVPGPFWPPAAALPPSSGWHAWQPALWSHAKWTANIRCSQHHDFSWNILWLPRNHYQLCTDLCGRVLWSLPSTTCNLTCGPTCVPLGTVAELVQFGEGFVKNHPLRRPIRTNRP